MNKVKFFDYYPHGVLYQEFLEENPDIEIISVSVLEEEKNNVIMLTYRENPKIDS